MSKINKLTTLAETKFLNLYNAEYSNKGGNIKNWIIASRKEKENLEGVYLNNKELQDDAVLIVPFHKEEEKIVEGIKRLGDVLKEALNETAEV